MEFVKYKTEWLEIARKQEEVLRLEALSPDDCIRLGLIMVRLAKESYKKSISVRIITGEQITFSHLMEGTSRYNEWWMDKKLNVSRATGMSSFRSLLEIAVAGRAMEPEFENEENYALCGGCFPLRTPAGHLLGYVESSGMKHEEDHQLIADALSEFMGVAVPTCIESEGEA